MAVTYTPRPRLTDGRFDMTASTDEDGRYTVAVGYCAGPRPPYESLPPAVTQFVTAEQWGSDAGDPAQYHTDGHAREADARRCWARFLCDAQRSTTVTPTTQEPCAVCGDWTSNMVAVGTSTPYSMRLCDAHNTASDALQTMIAAFQLAQ